MYVPIRSMSSQAPSPTWWKIVTGSLLILTGLSALFLLSAPVLERICGSIAFLAGVPLAFSGVHPLLNRDKLTPRPLGAEVVLPKKSIGAAGRDLAGKSAGRSRSAR